MTEEAEIVRLRRHHPKSPVELYIKSSGEFPEERIYILRLGQLADLAVDGTRFACSHLAGNTWQDMWARPFDHPELLSDP